MDLTVEIKRGSVSTSKILGIILLSTAGFAIGGWLWIRSAIDHSWAEMERTVHGLYQEAQARSGLRPTVRGNPKEGRAWELYDGAIQASMGLSLPRGDEEGFIPSRTMKAFVPALELFRQAGERSDGQRYRDWQHAETPKPVDRLARLLLAHIRSLTKAKEDRDSAHLLLDTLQFCGDAERNGSWQDAVQAGHWRSIALTRLKGLIQRGVLSRQDLSEVSRELISVGHALPLLRHTLINSAMEQGYEFLDLARQGNLFPKGEESVSWRFLFSERVAAASALRGELAYMQRLVDADQKPWVESLKVQEIALAQFLSVRNPILTRYATWASEDAAALLSVRRVQQAEIRLLQVAAHYLSKGKLLALEDPFEGMLHSSRTRTRLTIWSVGPDGVDNRGIDDGSGDWTLPRHLQGTFAHRFPGDIVVTVDQ